MQTCMKTLLFFLNPSMKSIQLQYFFILLHNLKIILLLFEMCLNLSLKGRDPEVIAPAFFNSISLFLA